MATTDLRTGSLERHGLSDEQLRDMFRNMLLQRQLDNRGFQLNRQGKVPFALGSEGHEALQAGAAMAFNRGHDILAPYYRDLGLCLGIGLSPFEILLSIFARAEDHNGGRQFPNHYSSKAAGLMSFSSILAAHLPHAVGAAFAIQYREETGRAVLATCGDGTTSEGEWHESMNFAAVHKLRVFVAVPEIDARAAATGAKATLTLDEFPGETFEGTIVRDSDSIAASSRTLNVEVDVDNAKDRIKTAGDALTKEQVPMATEPAFQFKA